MTAERFDLNYVCDDGELHRVYVIHRAPLGSHERMIAYLIEHFAGAFPVWMSPVQASIVPVSEKHVDYCLSIKQLLLKRGLRVEGNFLNEIMNYKIRNAVMQKIPYIIIVGDEEITTQTVSIRDRTGDQKKSLAIDKFIEMICHVINSKSLNIWE